MIIRKCDCCHQDIDGPYYVVSRQLINYPSQAQTHDELISKTLDICCVCWHRNPTSLLFKAPSKPSFD